MLFGPKRMQVLSLDNSLESFKYIYKSHPDISGPFSGAFFLAALPFFRLALRINSSCRL
jgi:hypothetical protein